MSPKVREAVPLPICHYNEPGMYWFLAEISLRHLHISVLRSLWKQSEIVHEPGIMYKSGIDYEPSIVYKPGIAYEPMRIKEHQQSLRKWYESLHPHVKFPEDNLPLLEPQKAFLRVHYFALHWVVCWPAVVRLVTKAPDDEKQHADLSRFSTEAIHYLIQHTFSIEALANQRHQMLFVNLIAYVLFFSSAFPFYTYYIFHITLRCTYSIPITSYSYTQLPYPTVGRTSSATSQHDNSFKSFKSSKPSPHNSASTPPHPNPPPPEPSPPSPPKPPN